jgi:hypothetical protein
MSAVAASSALFWCELNVKSSGVLFSSWKPVNVFVLPSRLVLAMPQRGNSEPVCQFPLTGAIVRTSEYDPADFDIACSLQAWTDVGNGPECDRMVMVRGGEVIMQFRVRYRPDFEGFMTTLMLKTTVARVNDYICKQAVLSAGSPSGKGPPASRPIVTPFVRSPPKAISPGSGAPQTRASSLSHTRETVLLDPQEGGHREPRSPQQSPPMPREEKASTVLGPETLDMSGYLVEEAKPSVETRPASNESIEPADEPPVQDPFWSSWLSGPPVPLQVRAASPLATHGDISAGSAPLIQSPASTPAQTPSHAQGPAVSTPPSRGSVAASYLAGWKQRGKERGLRSSVPLVATASPVGRPKRDAVAASQWFPESVTNSPKQSEPSSVNSVKTDAPNAYSKTTAMTVPTPGADVEPAVQNAESSSPLALSAVETVPAAIPRASVPEDDRTNGSALISSEKADTFDLPLPPPPWAPLVSQALFVSSTLDDVASLFLQAGTLMFVAFLEGASPVSCVLGSHLRESAASSPASD